MGGVNYFYTRDHLGSIRELTDSTGALRARYDYDPYGRSTKLTGDLDADFGYTGYYNHTTSGLYLTWYRAYDPNLGRWLSRDPIAERGGINLYDYVQNNSILYSDNLGTAIDSLPFIATINQIRKNYFNKYPGQNINDYSVPPDFINDTDLCEDSIDKQAKAFTLQLIKPDALHIGIDWTVGVITTYAIKNPVPGGVFILDSIVALIENMEAAKKIKNAAEDAKKQLCHCHDHG